MTTFSCRPIEDAARETDAVVQSSGRASADMLAALFDQSTDCIKILTPDGRFLYMSYNGRCAMEIDDPCFIQDKLWWDLWPVPSQPTVRRAVEEAAAGRAAKFVAACPTAKGANRWWEVSVSPVYDNQRCVTSLISISRDITQSRNDHEAATVLALEMRHRLKNAFAVSGAIAKASARGRSDEAKMFADELAQRYSVLAVAQGRVLDALGHLPLDQFLRELSKKFETVSGAIDVVGVPVLHLDESMMRTIALVVGELGNNSLKYGALGGNGRVRLVGKLADRRLRLEWHEQLTPGEPHTFENPGSEGSGFELMKRMAMSAGGAFTRTFDDNALVATLDLPLPAETPHA